MKCLFIPFATISGYETGANISAKDISRSAELYLKNLCVAAVSAKINGTKDCEDTEVAVVTNFEMPAKYGNLLKDVGVKMIQCPFDTFNFGAKYKWSLAFYKLCALKYMYENYGYEDLAFVDADVFVQGSLKNIWTECKEHILLYDIIHGLQVECYNSFLKEINEFCAPGLITHYGGEFFAAKKEYCREFIEIAEYIYQDMISKEFHCSTGDEFITSLVAYKMKNKIKNAAPYIFRFWTGVFYLTSTNYKFNPISILHVPAEKKGGMIKIFDSYVARGGYLHRAKLRSYCI